MRVRPLIKQILFLGGFCLLVFMALSLPTGEPRPSRFAYALHYEEGNPRPFLAQLDTETDSVVAKRKIDPMYNNFTIDLDNPNRLWISEHYNWVDFGREVDWYDFSLGRVVKSFKTKGIGPLETRQVGDKLYVAMWGTDQQYLYRSSGFEVFDQKTGRHLKTIDLGQGRRVEHSEFAFDYKRKKLYAVSWESSPKDLAKEDAKGTIFRIDVKTDSIEKSAEYHQDFAAARAVVLSKNRKLYICSLSENPGLRYKKQQYILVYDPDSLRLLKKIFVGTGPWVAEYSPLLNRLYVNHLENSAYIDVIDCNTDKVIHKIPVGRGSLMMSVVAPYKMYLSVGGSLAAPGILVIDLKTNQVVKKIPGLFSALSLNFAVHQW